MRKEVPTWMAVLIIVIVLLIVAIAGVFYLRPREVAEKPPIEEGGIVTVRPGVPGGPMKQPMGPMK